MTVFNLLNAQTITQSLPIPIEGGARGQVPVNSGFADLSNAGALTTSPVPSSKTYHVIVRAPQVGATVSCTVQCVGSNDGIHWIGDGAPIVIASGAGPSQAQQTTTSAFAYYTAFVQAISGTGAQVFCFMNA